MWTTPLKRCNRRQTIKVDDAKVTVSMHVCDDGKMTSAYRNEVGHAATPQQHRGMKQKILALHKVTTWSWWVGAHGDDRGIDPKPTLRITAAIAPILQHRPFENLFPSHKPSIKKFAGGIWFSEVMDYPHGWGKPCHSYKSGLPWLYYTRLAMPELPCLRKYATTQIYVKPRRSRLKVTTRFGYNARYIDDLTGNGDRHFIASVVKSVSRDHIYKRWRLYSIATQAAMYAKDKFRRRVPFCPSSKGTWHRCNVILENVVFTGATRMSQNLSRTTGT